MITGAMIAEVAALVGDPARATMVAALVDGRALTASELARAARITPQTASTHLAKLTAAGVLSGVRQGRHRHFRLGSAAVAEMIDGIVAVALMTRPRYRPLSREARALGAARICHEHLAGRLSVDLTDSLVARDHIVLDDQVAEITSAGARFLAGFGVELPRSRSSRPVSRLCLDWTERRPHIAGPVGTALTRRYFDLGWLERLPDSQAVRVTPRGRRGFQATFGLEPADPGERRRA
jgi:DNA-binding transcriptional ArsR family regulator